MADTLATDAGSESSKAVADPSDILSLMADTLATCFSLESVNPEKELL